MVLVSEHTTYGSSYSRILFFQAGKVLPGEQLQYTTDHVDKGTSYLFRVSAFNQLGTSGYLETEPILADDKYSKKFVIIPRI